MQMGTIAAWIRPRLYHLLSPLIALALVGLLDQYTDLIKRFEYQTVNLRFQTRASFDPPADPRLIFVAIDESSVTAIGKWEWPRTVEADFMNEMAKAGTMPHTVAFDVMFTEETDQLAKYRDTQAPADPQDAALADAFSNYPSVITGAFAIDPSPDPAVSEKQKQLTAQALLSAGPTTALSKVKGDITRLTLKDGTGSDVANFPVPVVRAQSLFGFVNDDPDPVDDIRHYIPLVVRVQDKVFPSLALQTLCQMLNVDADKVDVDLSAHVVQLTNSSGKVWKIPVDDTGRIAINYRRADSFTQVPFAALLQNFSRHVEKGEPLNPKCPDVTNKTLFIGGTATALQDMGPSPLAARSPLPYAHLNVLNNVLKNDYLTFVPWWWVVIGWALVTWPTLLRVKDAPVAEAVTVPIVLVVLYHVAAFAIFWIWSIQIAIVWPVASYVVLNFGAVVLRWREERKGREQIKSLFAQMISPEIMNHLLDNPENVKLGGADRPSTILFSDIRDYTKFSEGLEAEEVMRQLNVYFERMVPCVKECEGTFHKFIGDAIMAAWGDIAPLSSGPEKDAHNAVRSALMMRQRLAALNEERKTAGFSPMRIGIGLNHDLVKAGILGSSERKEFTVIGDGVNVASRLEGLTKKFKTDLAISESVRKLIGEDFLVRRLGLIVLQGKSDPTVVYEVLAEKSDLGSSRMSAGGVARYEEAFDHFLARRFDQAEALFVVCAKDYPDDHCVKTYLAESREFLVTPPPPDWDGRIVMTTK
jgi:adenylate cyclase